MEDWQIAVLNSENLKVDQKPHSDYRIVIMGTTPDNAMSIPRIVETIRNCQHKPVIMKPGTLLMMFADKKEVLDVLMAREEYVEYMMWKKEVEE